MTAGDLHHRLTILNRSEASDGHRGVTESWPAVRSRIAALVAPLRGAALERARQVDVRASHEVTVRWWRTYVDELDGGRARLVWHDGAVGNRTLTIVEPPREIEPRQFLSFVVKEAA